MPPGRQAAELHPGDTGLLGLSTGPEGRRLRTTRRGKCSGLSLQYSGHGVTSESPTNSDLDVTLQEGGGASGMLQSEERQDQGHTTDRGTLGRERRAGAPGERGAPNSSGHAELGGREAGPRVSIRVSTGSSENGPFLGRSVAWARHPSEQTADGGSPQ